MASNTRPPEDAYRLLRDTRGEEVSLSCATAESGFSKKTCRTSSSAFTGRTRPAHELSDSAWASPSRNASRARMGNDWSGRFSGPRLHVPRAIPKDLKMHTLHEPSDFRSRQYKATRLLYLRLTDRKSTRLNSSHLGISYAV